MRSVLELVADESARNVCRAILDERHVGADWLEEISESPLEAMLPEMLAHGLVVRSGDRYMATNDLERVLILTDGISNGDMPEVVARLRALYPDLRKISVVRDHVTAFFLRALFRENTIGNLWICSPWINLTDNQMRSIRQLISQSIVASEPYAVTVVMRPPELRDPKADAVRRTIAALREAGVEVYTNKRVHAKLYIRVPSTVPGNEIAAIGSQNLTLSRYTEIGLFIENDRDLIRDLQSAFIEIAKGA